MLVLGYPDWCAACRSAEFDKAYDKDKPALDLPFGAFLEKRFFTGESMAGTGVYTPDGKAVNDLTAESDRVLEQYPYETSETVPALVRGDFQLCDGHAVDRSARKEGERITRIRRQDGTRFYIHGSGWCSPSLRVFGTYTSVWLAGGSKMLVAKCSRFSQGSYRDDGRGYRPPLIRYTDVEEVGAPRMEGIAASLTRYFPPPPRPEQKAPAVKAARRRWFH